MHITKDTVDQSEVLERSLPLALLSIYMLIDLFQNKQPRDHWSYPLFDGLLAICLTAFAIASQAEQAWAPLLLASAITVVGVGHPVPIWYMEVIKRNRRTWAMFGIYLAVAGALILLHCSNLLTWWHQCLGIMIVIVTWLIVKPWTH